MSGRYYSAANAQTDPLYSRNNKPVSLIPSIKPLRSTLSDTAEANTDAWGNSAEEVKSLTSNVTTPAKGFWGDFGDGLAGAATGAYNSISSYFNPMSKFNTKGMSFDSEGNAYSSADDATKMSQNLQGMPGAGTSLFGGSNGSSLFDSLGGSSGLASIASGIGTLGSMYFANEANDRADEMHDAKMFEIKRERKKDMDFAKNMAASGLGSYSAGMPEPKTKKG